MDAVQRDRNLDLAAQSLLRVAENIATVKLTKQYELLNEQAIELTDTIAMLREIQEELSQEQRELDS